MNAREHFRTRNGSRIPREREFSPGQGAPPSVSPALAALAFINVYFLLPFVILKMFHGFFLIKEKEAGEGTLAPPFSSLYLSAARLGLSPALWRHIRRSSLTRSNPPITQSSPTPQTRAFELSSWKRQKGPETPDSWRHRGSDHPGDLFSTSDASGYPLRSLPT